MALLPFIDETSLYNAWNMAHAWNTGTNSTVAAAMLEQVRFLSENIDIWVYQALSTPMGSEMIDDEDY